MIPNCSRRCFDWERAKEADVLDDVKWSGRVLRLTLVMWCHHLVFHGTLSRLPMSSGAPRLRRCLQRLVRIHIGVSTHSTCLHTET